MLNQGLKEVETMTNFLLNPGRYLRVAACLFWGCIGIFHPISLEQP